MKVAIVLTGHMRHWREVLPNFKQRFIDKYNPDIFINTWSEEGWYGLTAGNDEEGFIEGTPGVEQKTIMEAYNAKAVAIQDFDDYRENFLQQIKRYPNYNHRSLNILSMFFKMGQGILMLEDHIMKTGTQYDLVIRTRPDMLVHQDLPDFDPKYFYTIFHPNHTGQGTGDMLQVGNSFSVINFCKAICYLPMIYDRTNLLCPHTASTTFIEMLNLPWQQIHLNKEFYR